MGRAMAVGTTTSPPDEMEEGEASIPPAMFITVRYGYEQTAVFCTDVPCKMLMARIQKACAFTFPDPTPKEFAKYDLKQEGQPPVGLASLEMERARKVLTTRGTYIFCGYDEEDQETELCMPEPVPEPVEGEEGDENVNP